MSTWKITRSTKEPGTSCILGPKDDDFVEALKAAIPSHSRKWLEGSGAWLIRDSCVRQAQRVIDRFTPGVTPDPTPLTPEELIEAAKGMGEDANCEGIIDGVVLGADSVYGDGSASTQDWSAVMIGGRLVVVAILDIKAWPE